MKAIHHQLSNIVLYSVAPYVLQLYQSNARVTVPHECFSRMPGTQGTAPRLAVMIMNGITFDASSTATYLKYLKSTLASILREKPHQEHAADTLRMCVYGSDYLR